MADVARRLLRPRIVLPAAAVAILVAVLLAPEPYAGNTITTLTTYRADPAGARGVYEVTQRLGWHTQRRTRPLLDSLDTRAVYAVLAAPQAMTDAEAGALLGAVRRGAGLVLVLGNPVPLFGGGAAQPIADSLQITASHPVMADVALDADSLPIDGGLSEHELPHRYIRVTPDSALAADSSRAPRPETDTTVHYAGDTVFVGLARPKAHPGDRPLPAVLGVPLGRGRIVVIADADLLRNSSLRKGTSAVLFVRALQWASPTPRPALVFDEYHFGIHAEGRGPEAVLRDALLHTPAGRAALQLLVAAAVLLLAFGIRAIRPTSTHRVERRSPLEHVGALASAYEQVHATRTATRLLVQGMRRRHAPPTRAREDEDAFLRTVAGQHPSLRPDVSLVRHALGAPLPTAQLAPLGQAIDHIDRTLSR